MPDPPPSAEFRNGEVLSLCWEHLSFRARLRAFIGYQRSLLPPDDGRETMAQAATAEMCTDLEHYVLEGCPLPPHPSQVLEPHEGAV